jgi:type IV pilus assembly protein PilC
MPVFGLLFKKAYMANFTRTFASLSSSGLPVMDIFKTVKTVIPNVLYQRDIEAIAKKVENGILISKALHESKLFPSMVGQLALVGEKSGRMSEVFDTLANYYEREVENTTKNLSALIEPIMMLFLGAGIGVLLIAVLQPIYGLVGAV